MIDFDREDSEDEDAFPFKPAPQYSGIRALSGPGGPAPPVLPVTGAFADPSVVTNPAWYVITNT